MAWKNLCLQWEVLVMTIKFKVGKKDKKKALLQGMCQVCQSLHEGLITEVENWELEVVVTAKESKNWKTNAQTLKTWVACMEGDTCSIHQTPRSRFR